MTSASGATRMGSRALAALLEGAIDYAGLFPPAALSMRDAASGFVAGSGGEASWALGRFVVPASRLEELAAATAQSPVLPNAVWPLSVLIGPALDDDAERVAAYIARVQRFAVVAVEGRAESVEEAYRVCRVLPPAPERFVEIPPAPGVERFVDALHAGNAAAKIRMGGVTPGAFPPASEVVAFLHACRAAGLPFKATAGLHHPVRAEYRLTYEPGSAVATMFGFLNVLMAGAFVWNDAGDDVVLGVLLERDAGAFQFDDDAASWSGHGLPLPVLQESRRRFARAIGSCSFEEPLQDLKALGLW